MKGDGKEDESEDSPFGSETSNKEWTSVNNEPLNYVRRRPTTEEIIRTVYPKRNGPQRRVFENGTIQDGTAVENIFEGRGTLRWPGGKSFVGEFRGGHRHRPGI